MQSSSSPARQLPVHRPQPSVQKQPSSGKNKDSKGLKQVKNKLKLFSIRLGMDMTFLFLVVILVIIGTIMMYSASYPSALEYQNNSQNYLIRQSIFAAIGLFIMISLSYFDYHYFHKLAPVILFVSLVLLVVVLFMPGVNSVHRWIPLGIFDLQASEVAKFAVILFFAHWSSIHFREMHTFKYGVLPGIIILGIIDVLLWREPHYSGIVIITLLGIIMLFLGGVRKRYFVALGILIAVGVGILVVTNKIGYAMERLDGWGQALVYINYDLWQTTYQTRNSLYAIGSGGIWGLGLGQSRQKYMYIPEAQNDFVFAVVCEELGLVGAILILLLFVLLVWRGITISMRAKDPFGSMLGTGLSVQIGIQAILNILVITDWLPNTGISLPFFSYGGSSLIMLLAQMGIVLSISRTSNLEKV
ncbi:MAG: cell division protein FtsW [Clostridia bacterium]|nr:cell division protein FtsW [Clostridia bacterium]